MFFLLCLQAVVLLEEDIRCDGDSKSRLVFNYGEFATINMNIRFLITKFLPVLPDVSSVEHDTAVFHTTIPHFLPSPPHAVHPSAYPVKNTF